MSTEAQNPLRDAIAEAIAENEIILFMKGNPEAPACGFSARAVGALKSIDVSFAGVDILPDPAIRQELSAISGWPTIPQLFVKGELVGGSDIIVEMLENGELATVCGSKAGAAAADSANDEATDGGLLQPENRL